MFMYCEQRSMAQYIYKKARLNKFHGTVHSKLEKNEISGFAQNPKLLKYYYLKIKFFALNMYFNSRFNDFAK